MACVHGAVGLCAAAIHGTPVSMGDSFTRLFAVTRSALWERIDLFALLKSYRTASGRFKVIGGLNDAWLPGFVPKSMAYLGYDVTKWVLFLRRGKSVNSPKPSAKPGVTINV